MKVLDFLKSKVSCGKNSCSKNCKICCFVKMVSILIILLVIVKIMVYYSVRKTIQNNPKMIIDSVDKYYKDQQRKVVEEYTKKAPEIAKKLEKTNPSFGNPNGSKVIIEFFDYACGHCKRQSVELMKVIKANSNVKVVLADLAIMSQHSLLSAQTGVYIALKNASKLERYYSELSKKQPINPESIKQVLRTIGLPENYIKLAEKDKQVEEIMRNNFQAAREIGLQGTPALIIDGKFVGGMTSASDILAMLR